uniref:DNA repair protein REV1 n=1 Tax=Callorhinchus milii TaxID=7868 RepID=A0A4W3GQV3_CALMI
MSHGGWRKRSADGDGWREWGGYMNAKVDKLEKQFRSDAPREQENEGTSSCIFKGVAIHVNGYTDPSADELRRLMMLHGGQYHLYYSRSKTTHIIATNLPNTKIKDLKEEKVVRPEWITDSIKVGRLLSFKPYQLYTKQSSAQKGLNFTVSKLEEPTPGPSNIHKLNKNVQDGVKCKEKGKRMSINGMNRWGEENEVYDLMELEHIFPNLNNGIHSREDHFSFYNNNELNFHSALKKQDYSKHYNETLWEKEPPHLTMLEDENDDCEMDFKNCEKQLAESSTLLSNCCRTVATTSSNECFKINGTNNPVVQGMPQANNTSKPSPSKASSLWSSRPTDPSFISEFYARSRLHHIATWKSEFTEYVKKLQKQSTGVYPAREKLKRIKMGKLQRNLSFTNTQGAMNVMDPPRQQNCIMHIDMDCFFVSVGIRDRPELKGKPVAVTHNRGPGHVPIRPGANPQLEMQYYQRRFMKGKAVPDKLDCSTWENPGATCTNGIDLDMACFSMAEIASCSYEARQAGIKNGMFFGQAKQLCPDLQPVSYDFQAYKEVAVALYETLASYTHDIEAVSCDEALVDVTAILTDTRLTPDEFATIIRSEIKEKTKCNASVGMGSNILLARVATGKAKPDGQYYLKPEEVDDFIRDQLVRNLPGVGRTLEYRLASLGVKTCGELQQLLMLRLQKEFGPKTGLMLYRFCRGLDDRPVRTEKERKSVSAEINYGVRFSQAKEAESFLLNLVEEIQRRLEASGMKGKRLTLKIMMRKAGAPTEPAKFGGHGICDNVSRYCNVATLDHATDNTKIISREILHMFRMMKLSITDMRGVGIHMHQLVPVTKTSVNPFTSSFVRNSCCTGPSHSVIDLLQNINSKKPVDHKLSDCIWKKTEIVEKGGPILLSPDQDIGFNNTETAVKAGGLHTPENVAARKLRLDLSIEVPSPSQIDPFVLEALPADIRQQVEQSCSIRQQSLTDNNGIKEPENGSITGRVDVAVGTVTLELPGPQEQNATAGITVALPAFSQVDPEVFSALPTDVQEELRAAYDQRYRQGENTSRNHHLILHSVSVVKNPLLQLKHAVPEKSKRRFKRKNQASPIKVQSPLKNRLLGSPSKAKSSTTGNPQIVLPDTIRHEQQVTEKLPVEPCASTSSYQAAFSSQHEIYVDSVYLRANLAGAYVLKDVKSLIKEWVTTTAEPVEEDILQVVKYCTDLIEEKDLEKLDLVIKYMKRLMLQSADSLWNMAFDFILDNVQVVMQQIYGSTLKFT